MLKAPAVKVIDFSTGECFSSSDEYKDSLKKLPKHKPTGYVGIDTKWLSDCKDAQDLKLLISQVDPYLLPKTRVVVDHAYLLDCVASSFLSAKNVGSILRLSKYCTAWNLGFTEKDKLVAASGVSQKNFSRWSDEIKQYVTFDKVFTNADVYRIIFNPIVVWRGCKLIRHAKIKQYYGGSSEFEEGTDVSPSVYKG